MEGLLRQDASETLLTLRVRDRNRYDNRYFNQQSGMWQIPRALHCTVAYRWTLALKGDGSTPSF
jgi:hypothetical protein